MKIWKALATVLGLAAAAAVIPYKVEKDDETEVTTVKALAWTAVKAPNPEDGGTRVDVAFLPGLTPEEPAGGIDIDVDITPDAEEAAMFDDSVELADIIPTPAAPKEPAEAPAAPEINPA